MPTIEFSPGMTSTATYDYHSGDTGGFRAFAKIVGAPQIYDATAINYVWTFDNAPITGALYTALNVNKGVYNLAGQITSLVAEVDVNKPILFGSNSPVLMTHPLYLDMDGKEFKCTIQHSAGGNILTLIITINFAEEVTFDRTGLSYGDHVAANPVDHVTGWRPAYWSRLGVVGEVCQYGKILVNINAGIREKSTAALSCRVRHTTISGTPDLSGDGVGKNNQFTYDGGGNYKVSIFNVTYDPNTYTYISNGIAGAPPGTTLYYDGSNLYNGATLGHNYSVFPQVQPKIETFNSATKVIDLAVNDPNIGGISKTLIYSSVSSPAIPDMDTVTHSDDPGETAATLIGLGMLIPGYVTVVAPLTARVMHIVTDSILAIAQAYVDGLSSIGGAPSAIFTPKKVMDIIAPAVAATEYIMTDPIDVKTQANAYIDATAEANMQYGYVLTQDTRSPLDGIGFRPALGIGEPTVVATRLTAASNLSPEGMLTQIGVPVASSSLNHTFTHGTHRLRGETLVTVSRPSGQVIYTDPEATAGTLVKPAHFLGLKEAISALFIARGVPDTFENAPGCEFAGIEWEYHGSYVDGQDEFNGGSPTNSLHRVSTYDTVGAIYETGQVSTPIELEYVRNDTSEANTYIVGGFPVINCTVTGSDVTLKKETVASNTINSASPFDSYCTPDGTPPDSSPHPPIQVESYRYVARTYKFPVTSSFRGAYSMYTHGDTIFDVAQNRKDITGTWFCAVGPQPVYDREYNTIYSKSVVRRAHGMKNLAFYSYEGNVLVGGNIPYTVDPTGITLAPASSNKLIWSNISDVLNLRDTTHTDFRLAHDVEPFVPFATPTADLTSMPFSKFKDTGATPAGITLNLLSDKPTDVAAITHFSTNYKAMTEALLEYPGSSPSSRWSNYWYGYAGLPPNSTSLGRWTPGSYSNPGDILGTYLLKYEAKFVVEYNFNYFTNNNRKLSMLFCAP